MTDPDRLFAIVESTINDLLRSGWHPDKIIETAGLLIKDSPDFTESQLHDWVWGNYESLKELGGVQRKQRPIANEIKRFLSCLDLKERSDIYLSEVYEELQIITTQDKAAAQTFFSRETTKKGLLKKIGRGHFRIKVPECERIDIFSETGQEVDFKWPLGLHEYYMTLPKNIIIVAGEPDAGKTAFLLNCAGKNMNTLPIHYFSSEMGALELKDRLSKFRMPLELWRKINWKERAVDFCDVIQPNDVNIIDYIEIHDEFYKIGGIIFDIHQRLDKGIAIIALQKNAGRDLALGGERSLEKARLYITMERIGRTKIVKCKNWRDATVNPNGLCKRWRLGGGCHFKEEGGWLYETDEDKASMARSAKFQSGR